MLGVVLCGGQSTRMTSDKGLLTLNEDTWAQISANKLKTLGVQVAISVNRSQVDAYSLIFPREQLVADNDELQIKGPLCGILSVHVQHPEQDLFVLACDMPMMQTDLLTALLVQYQKNILADSFIYSNDGELEPLCGIYRSKGLARIMHLYLSEQFPKHSMKYMLEQIKVHFTPVPGNRQECFRNFNTRTELNGL